MKRLIICLVLALGFGVSAAPAQAAPDHNTWYCHAHVYGINSSTMGIDGQNCTTGTRHIGYGSCVAYAGQWPSYITAVSYGNGNSTARCPAHKPHLTNVWQ